MNAETLGMPRQYTSAAVGLVFGDGQVLPLEYTCPACDGKGGECKQCKGKGSQLSGQGRTLLAFLKKWGDE